MHDFFILFFTYHKEFNKFFLIECFYIEFFWECLDIFDNLSNFLCCRRRNIENIICISRFISILPHLGPEDEDISNIDEGFRSDIDCSIFRRMVVSDPCTGTELDAEITNLINIAVECLENLLHEIYGILFIHIDKTKKPLISAKIIRQ